MTHAAIPGIFISELFEAFEQTDEVPCLCSAEAEPCVSLVSFQSSALSAIFMTLEIVSLKITLAGVHTVSDPSLQNWRGKKEMSLDQAWHCWCLGREKYHETVIAEDYWESGWGLSPGLLKPKL